MFLNLKNNLIKSININFSEIYKKVINNQMIEYYIQDDNYYQYCSFDAIDNRKFGFIINKSNANDVNSGLFLIREINKNHFLVSRMDRQFYKINNYKHLEILPVKKKENTHLWTTKESNFKSFGSVEKENGKLEIINKINNLDIIYFLVDELTYDIEYENLIYLDLLLSQRYLIFRIPYGYKSDIKSRKSCESNICLLNSYCNNSVFELCVKKNISMFNDNLIEFYKAKNNTLSFNQYIDNYNRIIYFGHGYVDRYLQIDLQNKIDVKYNSISNIERDWIIFLACNESINQGLAEYNSILSLFNAGFKEVLVTNDKIIVDEIYKVSPILLSLILLTNSISLSVLYLSRLSLSVIPLTCPFRLYKNPNI